MVIVKFKNRDLKNTILHFKKFLINTNVGITEHLTPNTRSLIADTKAAFPDHKVWTEDCKVFVQWGNSKRCVYDEKRLAKLSEKWNAEDKNPEPEPVHDNPSSTSAPYNIDSPHPKCM